MRNAITALMAACTFAAATCGGASAEPANWAGFYAGVHGGYGWNDLYGMETDQPTLKGGLGGVHGGYLWQWQKLVAGVEVDYSWSRLHWGRAVTDTPGEIGQVELSTDWLASLRGRLGYDLGPILLYGTAGVARMEWSLNWTTTNIASGSTAAVTGGSSGTGWVAGGGAELKITDSIIARIEALHYRFSDLDLNFKVDGIPVSVAGDKGALDSTMTVARGGLSFRF